MTGASDDTLVDERAVAPVFSPGTIIADRYLIERELGRGAAGAVYAARDEELGDLVALKVIHPAEVRDDEQRDRIRREVRLARRVTHRNVARTYDIGQAGAVHFLTMELIQGVSLHDLIHQEAPIGSRRSAEIAAEIADGLDAAHRAGVVHRDLKPANVLVQFDGRAVITDFGVARSTVASSEQTHDGYRLIGTPAYMAPEQVEGNEISAQTDLYALGLILFELLTGCRPFGDESALAAAVARVQRDPTDVRTLANISPELASLVDELLRRDPAKRPRSAAGVAALLRAGVENEPRETQLVVNRAPSLGELDDPRPVFAPLNPGNRGLAVLPLEYRGDPASAYVAEAVTDELVDVLSMTRGLRVPARSATQRYAEDRDPQRIGAELDVNSVVDGTLMWQGTRIRLTIRLIDARTGEQTWAQRFDGAAGDVFDIQDRIARRVAESLRLEAQLRASPRAIKAEAAMTYMLARRRAQPYDAGGSGPEGAVHAYERCLELEPGFAPALAGAALVRARMLFFRQGEDSSDNDLDACRRAVATALERAGGIPETHIAAARLATEESDYAAAATELLEALELAPTCAAAHAFLGSLQCEAGRPEEGIRRIELASELDPDSGYSLLTAARHHALHGRMDAAERMLARAVLIDPRIRVIAEYGRIRMRAYQGDFETIQQALEARREPTPVDSRDPEVLLRAYLGESDPGELAEYMRYLDRPGGSRRRSAMMLQMATEALACRGQVEASLPYLDRANELGLIDLDWMLHCSLLNSIRGEDRFTAVLADVRGRAEALWRA